MKKSNFFKNKVLSMGLAATMTVALGTIALASSGGSADPLISLSYLEEIVTPAMEAEAISQAEIAVSEAEFAINKEIASLKTDLSGSNVTGASEFLVITLGKGDRLTLNEGTQAVLRVGAATISNTALLNLTQGSAVPSNAALTINHLYLATESGVQLTALENTVKVMVSGGYSLS